MVFSSESFLFLFLPAFLALYYLTPLKWRSLTILFGSYVFYAWWRVDFLGLLILTTLWSFTLGRKIAKHGQTRTGRIYLAIAVAGCLGVLGVFKYLNFFIDSFAALVGTDAEGLGIHWRLILPIGISFYVFQAVSYIIDVYRGDASAHTKFLDFAAFIALFPQLIAGPILRYKDLEHQFESREHSLQLFYRGMTRFIIGLAKKVLLADAIAPVADYAFSHPDPSFGLSWLGTVAYTLQLYFDFSGYSSMAIGLGMMMGFRFIENFNTPYISKSITEFWRRWHISLSVWLRDYLYIPLGGNRGSEVRTYFNLMAVMTLGGMWHGAAWTFIIWGIWHGGILAIERATGFAKRSPTLWWSWPMTMLFVMIGWVIFRAETVGIGFSIYAGMFGFNGFDFPIEEWMQISSESIAFIILAIGIAAIEPKLRQWFAYASDHSEESMGALTALRAKPAFATAMSILMVCIAFFTIAKLAEQSVSPFLYFQF